MRAFNLFTLTRTQTHSADFSRLLQALSDRSDRKTVSIHEASSLCALVDRIEQWFTGHPEYPDWIRFLDGFWFSYSIAHISKEFDLLKFSADASSVLNIELKSEDVPEDRIRRQLEQNRYYLSNVSRTIYSFTYVMETDTIYQLKDNKYLQTVTAGSLASVLAKTRFHTWIPENLDRYFRASDYLISPVSTPERLLQGKYFLTNQQWEFRRRILNLITEKEENRSAQPADPPIITLTGSAGTGKTLLLFDLAIVLSRKKEVLFLHGGPLREGHHVLNRRLRNVTLLSGTDPDLSGLRTGLPGQYQAAACTCIMIDEANRLPANLVSALLQEAKKNRIPCILAYDPYSIRSIFSPMEDSEEVIASNQTHTFAFSGNIRINRPIFSFMRNVFSLKEKTEQADYSCIDVLYANNRREEQLLGDYYTALGYTRIDLSSGALPEDELVAQEYECVLIVMDNTFYYDEAMHLCRTGDDSAALSVLYEALTRTRERLAVLITENNTLFSRILQIRTP